MKKSKKWIVIILVIIAIIITVFFLIRLFIVPPYKVNIDPKDIHFYKEVNEYCYNMEDEEKATSLGTTALEYNDAVYYINPSTKTLYKADLAFQNERVVVNKDITGFAFKNNRLYYTTENNVYYMEIESSDAVELADVNPDNIIITNEYVIFTDDKQHLYRSNLDGNNIIKLSDREICELFIKGDKVFYTDYHTRVFDSYVLLYAMNDDGSNHRLLIDIDMENGIYIDQNNVFFSRCDGKIYRFDLQEKGIQTINDDRYSYGLFVFDSRLYYAEADNEVVLISCNYYGEDKKVIDNNSAIFVIEGADNQYLVYERDSQGTSIVLCNIINGNKTLLYDKSIMTSVLLNDSICLRHREFGENNDPQDSLLFFNYQGELLNIVE